MPLIYRARDDIFDTKGLDVIVNYPTLDPGWEKGLPAVFKQRYPTMYEEWLKLLASGQLNVGKTFLWEEDKKPSVINLPLKKTFMEYQSFSLLVQSFIGLRHIVETSFNSRQKVVLPIVVTHDGTGFILQVMREILNSPNIFYEVSLSPLRLQGFQAERKVYYVNWTCSGEITREKIVSFLTRLQALKIHDGNTQVLLGSKAFVNAMLSSNMGFNMSNPLLHVTIEEVSSDSLPWLQEKGIDGTITVSGSDNLSIIVDRY